MIEIKQNTLLCFSELANSCNFHDYTDLNNSVFPSEVHEINLRGDRMKNMLGKNIFHDSLHYSV